MDINKAIEILQGDIEELDECINDTEIDDDFIEFCTDRKEVFKLAIGALEKQVPKMPESEYDDEFTCPGCGKYADGFDVTQLKYCPDCGQNLDWGGNDGTNI